MARRRPVTHALALWITVGFCAVVLIIVCSYIVLLSRAGRIAVPAVYPPRGAAAAPSTLFGTVTSVGADGVLQVDSKQPFTSVAVDELTKVTTVAGAPARLSDLKAGAQIMATGKDLGGGRLLASAVAIVEAGSGTAPAAVNILQAPADWNDWCTTLPPVIGWGAKSSDNFVAVRDCDPKLPSVSVLIFGADGSVTERIELDVPGYKQMRPLNPFLTPDEAEKRLEEIGIVAGASMTSPDGAYRITLTVSASGKRTFKLVKQ